MKLEFNSSHLLLEPEDVATVSGDNTKDSCFLPLFSDKSSALANGKRWILGTHVLREYYTVYDATSFDKFIETGEKKGLNRIGIVTSTHHDDVVPQPPKPKPHLAMMSIIVILVLSVLLVGAVGYCICCRRRRS